MATNDVIRKVCYEYQMVTVDSWNNNVDALNVLAREGWEIVQCDSTQPYWTVLLRREVCIVTMNIVTLGAADAPVA